VCLNKTRNFRINGRMKRLLVCAISLVFLQTVKADPRTTDSSRISRISFSTQQGSGDTILVPIRNAAAPVNRYQGNIYIRRLDSIQNEVPLDYNEYVQSYIDLYLQRRDDISRDLGLTNYYFPIYQKVFQEAGVPQEIAYLSVVESQLNPYAVSRVGATGLWQFMPSAARTYGLVMDGNIDERRDPVQSSKAAAAFLKDAYQEFGDWLLAIASYNCGRSNVIRAIEQAGSNNFWAIRQYLPVETRGYVPAYIAVTYIMNYHKKYNIHPQFCNLSFKTDTVSINKSVSLSSISNALNIDIYLLTQLNPQYKLLTINGTVVAPRSVVIPKAAKEQFGTVYASLNTEMFPVRAHSSYTSFVEIPKAPVQPALPEVKAAPTQTMASLAVKKTVPAPKKKEPVSVISYRVQQGDTLSGIANKFGGTSADEIKELNGLKEDDVQPGTMLMIGKS